MTVTSTTSSTRPPASRRERRRLREWQIRRPKKNQPATSQCPTCGVAFGALTTRVAIRARKQHELEAHR